MSRQWLGRNEIGRMSVDLILICTQADLRGLGMRIDFVEPSAEVTYCSGWLGEGERKGGSWSWSI